MQKEHKKICLVSGGSGFIGSHLCDALLGKGYSVFCVDNLITGSEDNLKEAKKNKDFTFVKFDVTAPLPLLGKIDYIFHLASPASVVDYQKYTEETMLVNSKGTTNLLDVAKTYSSKFLFTSTSEIYGDPKVHPQSESYWGNVNPIGVRACYDESKRFGEMATMVFVRKYGLDARIVRVFNTYGPRMRKNDGRVISNFINQAISNAPITIYGKGVQTRSFCYVSDLVDGLMKAMFQEKTAGEVFNLGNPEEISVKELAEKIKVMTGSDSSITNGRLPEDDPVMRQPDITKAMTVLGWKPGVLLDDGLTKTIAYYQSLT